ncbi:hypothetical protein ACC848_42930, partial [Rhizobium johnstonii]
VRVCIVTSIEPRPQVGALLQPRVAGSFHGAAERECVGGAIDQVQGGILKGDEDVVELTPGESLPELTSCQVVIERIRGFPRI